MIRPLQRLVTAESMGAFSGQPIDSEQQHGTVEAPVRAFRSTCADVYRPCVVHARRHRSFRWPMLAVAAPSNGKSARLQAVAADFAAHDAVASAAAPDRNCNLVAREPCNQKQKQPHEFCRVDSDFPSTIINRPIFERKGQQLSAAASLRMAV